MPAGHHDVRDGDYAYAWQIQDIWDLLTGVFGEPVNLTRYSSATIANLRVGNRNASGPSFEVVQEDGTTVVVAAGREGFSKARFSSYLDLKLWGGPIPDPPGAGLVRVYPRAGQLYFLVESSPIENQIPIGAPPSTHLWNAAFFGG